MNEINYWERFMETGRVDDFLAYRNAAADRQAEDGIDRERAGEGFHAGIYTDHGDGVKG